MTLMRRGSAALSLAVRLLRASAAAAAGVTSADSMAGALGAVSGSAVSDATIGVSGTGAVRERAGAAWAAFSFTRWSRADAQSAPQASSLVRTQGCSLCR